MSGRSINKILRRNKKEKDKPQSVITGGDIVRELKKRGSKKKVEEQFKNRQMEIEEEIERVTKVGEATSENGVPIEVVVVDNPQEQEKLDSMSDESTAAVEAKKRIPAKDFVSAWQRSTSVQGVADALGVNAVYASARAAQLRKQGVKLKKFTRGKGGKRLDVDALNALAESELPPATQPEAQA